MSTGLPPSPVLPPGTPPARDDAPKRGLTQEQIDYLVELVSGYWPAFRKLWPIIVIVFPLLFGAGTYIGAKMSGGLSTDATYLGGKLDTIVMKMAHPLEAETMAAVTRDTDPALMKKLPPSVSVRIYEEGTKWAFNGTILPLPVIITRENGVDVKVEALK